MTGRARVIRITSQAHPVVKLARSLGSAHGRRRSGLVLVEGVRAAEATAKTRTGIRAAQISTRAMGGERARKLAAMLAEARVPVYELPDELYVSVTRVDTPQGVALLCPSPDTRLEDVLKGDLVAVVDGIGDPGNMGSILRSARAFHLDGVVTTAGSVEAANPKSVRASAGAWPGVPLAEGVDPDLVVGALRERGFRIVLADARAPRCYREDDWGGRVAIVLGGEAGGAGDVLRRAAEEGVRIPVSGMTESLNVAAAAAVLFAEAAHRRGVAGEGRSSGPSPGARARKKGSLRR